MNPRTLCTLLAVVIALFTAQLQGQTDALRWKLEKGQKFKIVSVNDTKAELDTPMGVQKMPSKLTTTMTWEVVEAKDGNYKVKQKIDRIQVNMVIPFVGTDINYDSDEKDTEIEGQAAIFVNSIKQMVGNESEIEFNNRGIVKKSEKSDDQGGGNMLMMGEDMASQMFFELPEGAVKKGETWDQKIETKIPGGSVVMKNKYTYDGKSGNTTRDLHQIKMKGDLEMDVEQSGVTMTLDEGSIEGTLVFDNTSGHLAKADLKQKMVMEIDAQVQTMTNRATATVKVTITEEK